MQALTLAGHIRIPSNSAECRNLSIPTEHCAEGLASSGGGQCQRFHCCGMLSCKSLSSPTHSEVHDPSRLFLLGNILTRRPIESALMHHSTVFKRPNLWRTSSRSAIQLRETIMACASALLHYMVIFALIPHPAFQSDGDWTDHLSPPLDGYSQDRPNCLDIWNDGKFCEILHGKILKVLKGSGWNISPYHWNRRVLG